MPTVDIQAAMRVGMEHHAKGELQQAKAAYLQVVAQEPNNPEALHLLGALELQLGNPQQAVALIGRAIQAFPGNPSSHNNLGEAYRALGDIAQAIRCYTQAIALKPGYLEARYNLGMALLGSGRNEEAVSAFREIVRLRPDFAEAHDAMGLAQCAQGRFDEAVACHRRAIELKTNLAPAYNNLGNALLRSGRAEEAIVAFRQATCFRPDFAEANNNLGMALGRRGRLDEAIGCFLLAIETRADFAEAHYNLGTALRERGRLDGAVVALKQAVHLRGDFAEAHYNLGNALWDSGRMEEAIGAYRKAVELKPDYPDALVNLGNALREKGELEEAVAVFRRAIALSPNLADAYCDLAVALQDKGDLDEGIAACEKAIQLLPDHADAHWNKSLILLLKGDFAEGWREFEWRWQCRDFPSPRREFAQPAWKGEDPAGRTILFHAEQGLGDTIQFIRYAALVARRGGHVVVECQPELKSLLAGVEGVERALARGEMLPPFDLHLPLLSLPLVLGTTLQTIPAQVPYLKADPYLVEAWRTRIAVTCHSPLATRHSPLNVGLVWAGSPQRAGDRFRSLPLSALAPLAAVKGVRFYSLQKDGPAGQAKNPPAGLDLVDRTEELQQFSDTAALVANLDLVISVDTAVAHLTGAMGKPVWTLLEFVPAWRWLMGREDCPWYPTMRLFRQPSRGDWASVVRKVAGELEKRVQRSGFRVQ